MRQWPTGGTQVVAVIGDPISHSLSPAIHNAAFAALGIDWICVAFRAGEGDTAPAIRGVKALRIRGLSVTMPHKSAAAHCVDALTDTAAALGAVNAIVLREDGTLLGDSTDGQGFLDSLELERGFVPAGMKCVVVGAGGAARSVVMALAGAGAAEVIVVNRSADRAGVAAALAAPRGRVGSAEDIRGADLVVNATPIGMLGGPAGQYPVDPAALGVGQLAVDLVYSPVVTPFLAAAAGSGAIAVPGAGMLVHQAARAFSLWTGVPAPIDIMAGAISDELR